MRIKDDAPSPQPEKVFYDNRIKRKNVLPLNEKVSAIREYERTPVYKRIGRLFNCSPDQIKRIVQQKDTILKAWEQRTRRCQDAKTLEFKVVRVSMLGKAVYEWIRRMMYYKDFMITDGLIQKMALQFKSEMGLLNFFPHQEWYEKFRSTYKIMTNDSKTLNIGYAQGYSVQIKDIIKDVLSECTHDDVDGETDEDDDEDDDSEQLMDDVYFDDNDNGNWDGGSEQPPAAKKMRTITLKQQSTHLKLVAAKNNNNVNNNNNIKNNENCASTSKKQQQQQQQQRQQQSQQQQRQVTAIQMPKLQPIRQLVALPIQTSGLMGAGGGGGMTQKVLVATPITPNNVQRNGGSGGNGAPMTMTIIPFTTLAQASQPQQCVQLQRSNTPVASSSPASARKTNNERSTLPPPMIEIKTEIKKEPVDIPEVYIKQECISDDEAEAAAVQQQQQQTTTQLAKPKPVAELPEGAAVKVNFRPNSSDDTIDDDNLVLSSLRQLIRKPPSNVENVAVSISGEAGSTTRSARGKQLPSKSTVGGSANTTLKTTTASSTSTSTATTTSVTTATSATRVLSSKAKRNNNDADALPPIKSCMEARRYLKLLEDFALYKENYRLIGLITRADEVLRELDGDDDVDID